MRTQARALVRMGTGFAVLPVALLVAPSDALAAQAEPAARAQADTMPFGLFGPVGLIAIALGIVGMVAGAVRQRRKVRATADAESPAGQETTRPVMAPVDTKP